MIKYFIFSYTVCTLLTVLHWIILINSCPPYNISWLVATAEHHPWLCSLSSQLPLMVSCSNRIFPIDVLYFNSATSTLVNRDEKQLKVHDYSLKRGYFFLQCNMKSSFSTTDTFAYCNCKKCVFRFFLKPWSSHKIMYFVSMGTPHSSLTCP